MATKKKKAKKPEGRYLVLENGERFEITGEDGRFYICGDRRFGKNYPALAGVEENEKTEQEQTEGE